MGSDISIDEQGIVRQILKPLINAEDLLDDLSRLKEIESELKQSNQPFILLVDGEKVRKADSRTRKQGIRNLNELNYEKIAVIGVSGYLRHVVNMVLRATGKGHNIRVFQNEPSAVNWLLQSKAKRSGSL